MSSTCAAGQETNPSQNSNPAEFLLMKSDKNHRNKDKVKALDSISWAIADLSFASGEASNDREFIAQNLKQLSQSASARLLIKEAGEQGWRIGLSHLEHHDFHLDVPAKTIVLDNHGLDAEGFARAPYFYHAVQASLIRALRDAWQEKRHGGFDENYTPESVLLLERIRAADSDVMTVAIAWEMNGDLWRHMTGSEDSDIALAFSSALEKDPVSNGRALTAAFRQWFRNVTRVNTCDHETLEYMDEVMNANGPVFGKKRAGKICVEVLSCLPDKTAYLRGLGDDILSDPLYAGLSDPINQTHFMHVMRDSSVHYVQNVPFRDAALAAKIFPNGEMTPEREEVKQRS
ncbi:MAG: hypothetical protein KA155_09630 [Alphaproteobacteria bacterium]|jgi:hypothetical protein|nr:hypothetical protein [Alphaproteobacteria bacterium]